MLVRQSGCQVVSGLMKRAELFQMAGAASFVSDIAIMRWLSLMRVALSGGVQYCKEPRR